MKLQLLILPLLVVGCGQKSPYDVSPAQVNARKSKVVHGAIDLNHLPAGAKKEVKTYHKGDVLPDGTISPGERKVVKLSFSSTSGGGGTSEGVQVKTDSK